MVIILLIVCNCSSLYKNHDINNPCAKEGLYYDSVACDEWKSNFPREYHKYQKRVAEDSIQ